MAFRVVMNLLFAFMLNIRTFASRTIDNHCGLYLAPSTVPGAGRGIISGGNYRPGEVVEIASTTAFLAELMLDYSQLNNYVYAYDEDYSMMIFGAGSLYNHNKKSTVKHYWVVAAENLNKPSDYQWTPFNMGNDVWIRATEFIAAGEEVFAYYGENWFNQRDILEVDLLASAPAAEPVPLSQLDQYGHCLTDVGVSQSYVPFAGKGLFARRPFKAGEVVVIAPVLTLSRAVIDKTNHSSALLNFCFTLPNNMTEVVLFPLNNAALINHQPESSANLALSWYDWSSLNASGAYFDGRANLLTLSDLLALTPEALFNAPFGQFDLAFTALRDIEDGEELFFNYGHMWGHAWNKYVEEVQVWQKQQQSEKEQKGVTTENLREVEAESSGEQGKETEDEEEEEEVDTSTMPRFRSYIELPESMVPRHWLRSQGSSV